MTRIQTIREFNDMKLQLITSECKMYTATERDLPAHWDSLPWWGFVWPGGYGQASYILNDWTQGLGEEKENIERIVDFACGCGIGTVAALQTSVPKVLAIDICPYATTSTLINVELNSKDEEQNDSIQNDRLSVITEDIIGTKVGEVIQPSDLMFCGDVLYDDAFASALLPWLQDLAMNGINIIVSDPGRWVIQEMPLTKRDNLLKLVSQVDFEKWFSNQNHGLLSSNLYKILPPKKKREINNECK